MQRKKGGAVDYPFPPPLVRARLVDVGDIEAFHAPPDAAAAVDSLDDRREDRHHQGPHYHRARMGRGDKDVYLQGKSRMGKGYAAVDAVAAAGRHSCFRGGFGWY